MFKISSEVRQECSHDKVYDNEMLMSNPPKKKWRCSKCSEIGYKVIGVIE